MKIKLCSPILPIAAIASLLGFGSALVTPAQAFQLSHLESDAEFLSLVQDIAFVGEGRIGDNGTNRTFELNIHEDDPGNILPGDSANFVWTNGQAQAFSLSYDQATKLVTYTVGTVTLDYTADDPFTDIFIRTRASSTSSLTVNNLVLNGVALGDSSSTVNDPERLDYLRISGLSGGDFTLTGNSIMDWTGSTPTNSNLAYQIKVATAVPEPSTVLGLLSVTALGAFFKRKQKRQQML